jgi:methyltransferase (TIGR00027 family)
MTPKRSRILGALAPPWWFPSSPGRPTTTALLVAAARALYTALPAPYKLAPDPVAKDVVPTVLALPARVAEAAPSAGPMIHRALGAVTLGLSAHVELRTRAIDDALLDGIARGATQLVLLGAGLDGRAHRLDALAAVRVFEVDQPGTHAYKTERLAHRRTPPLARSVARVAVDFERDRLDAALLKAGFAPSEGSFWIWEGVTVYLTPDAIEATLRAVSDLAAPESRIAVTYTRPGGRRFGALVDPAARALAGAVREPLRGMMDTEAMFAALARAGFEHVSDDGDNTLAARYWPSETIAHEWERLAVAERAATPRS